MLKMQWKLIVLPGQEPLLKDAGVPIPEGYVPTTKSYTLSPPTSKGYGLQILLGTQWIPSNSVHFLWMPGDTHAHTHTKLFSNLWKYIKSHPYLLRMPRWFQNQIYCNGYVTVLSGFRHNSKNGITVSTQKHGGWNSSFPMASKMAGWDLVWKQRGCGQWEVNNVSNVG